jgi:hypothetical protein
MNPPELARAARADLLLCAHRWRVMGTATALAEGVALERAGLVVGLAAHPGRPTRYSPTPAGIARAVELAKEARSLALAAERPILESPPKTGGVYAWLRQELDADASLRARSPHVATRAVVDVDGQDFVRALYRAFDACNVTHFSGKLAPPMVLITFTSPRAFGDHVDRDVHGLRSVIRVHPRSAARGYLFAADVLLHEMIHTWQAELLGDLEAGYRGHGPHFARKCNAIGGSLGLPEVGVKGRRGLPDCAQWPICVRPAGYYDNAEAEAERAKRAAPKLPASPAAARDGEGEGDDEPPPSGRARVAVSPSIVKRAALLCRQVSRSGLAPADVDALERTAARLLELAATWPGRSELAPGAQRKGA